MMLMMKSCSLIGNKSPSASLCIVVSSSLVTTYGCHFDLNTNETKQTNKCNEILLLNSGWHQLLQLETSGIGGWKHTAKLVKQVVICNLDHFRSHYDYTPGIKKIVPCNLI